MSGPWSYEPPAMPQDPSMPHDIPPRYARLIWTSLTLAGTSMLTVAAVAFHCFG